MAKAGQVIAALVAFAFGLMMVSNVIPTSIDATLAEDYSQNYSVVTGPGTTTAVATLSYDHYYGDLRYLDATTNLQTDDPYVMSYTPSTKEVLVDGLSVSGTRIMTIDYVRETDNSMFFGWGTFVTAVPFLIGIGLIANLIRSMFS